MSNPKYLILDIETNALHNPDVIHCVVVRSFVPGGTGPSDYAVYRSPESDPSSAAGLRASIAEATCIVGRNIIGYDAPVLQALVPQLTIDRKRVIDTLVISQLLNYNVPGGHSLEAWGERFGFHKIKKNGVRATKDQV